jgi:hypothetical protein
VGDNFAVNVKVGNLEGMNFWIILCIRPLRQVKKAFKNKWGTSFEVGDEMVVGLYYQKWGTSDYTYVLLKDSHLVFMHSYLVHAIKFLMPPKDYRVSGNDQVYELNEYTMSRIKFVLASLNDD